MVVKGAVADGEDPGAIRARDLGAERGADPHAQAAVTRRDETAGREALELAQDLVTGGDGFLDDDRPFGQDRIQLVAEPAGPGHAAPPRGAPLPREVPPNPRAAPAPPDARPSARC